ncbi:hypothetical protein VUR80DRAFT_8279 [Thermomyces stellatus]
MHTRQCSLQSPHIIIIIERSAARIPRAPENCAAPLVGPSDVSAPPTFRFSAYPTNHRAAGRPPLSSVISDAVRLSRFSWRAFVPSVWTRGCFTTSPDPSVGITIFFLLSLFLKSLLFRILRSFPPFPSLYVDSGGWLLNRPPRRFLSVPAFTLLQL